MLLDILHQLGLSNNESKVYATLLEHGESTASQIITNADIRTGKAYELFESLRKKGLLSVVTKKGVKYFSAADPRNLLRRLEEEQTKLDQSHQEAEKLLPQLLKQVNNTKGETHIELYSGLKGLQVAYAKEFAHAKKSSTLYVLGVIASDKYPKAILDHFVYNIKPERERKGYKIRKLLSKESRKWRHHHEPKASIRYLPYASLVTINIIESLSIIGIQTEEPITITIESKEVAESFKHNFDLLWKLSRP